MMAVMKTVLCYCTLHRTILEGLNQGKIRTVAWVRIKKKFGWKREGKEHSWRLRSKVDIKMVVRKM